MCDERDQKLGWGKVGFLKGRLSWVDRVDRVDWMLEVATGIFFFYLFFIGIFDGWWTRVIEKIENIIEIGFIRIFSFSPL